MKPLKLFFFLECEKELDIIIQNQTSKPDVRELLTWLAVTSRELKSCQNKTKGIMEEAKKMRDRLASEKLRSSTLSEELRKRSSELTHCEGELKNAEEKMKKQQEELVKFRTMNVKHQIYKADQTNDTPDSATVSKSNQSLCRDIFESPMFVAETKKEKLQKAKQTTKTTSILKTPNVDDEDDCLIVDENCDDNLKRKRTKKDTMKLSEPSPVTPNSVTEFRKMAQKALKTSHQSGTSQVAASSVPPPPMRRGYNGMGGHGMTFAFPVSQRTKPQSFFPSQSAPKRKL